MCFKKKKQMKTQTHRTGGAFLSFDLANSLGCAHKGGGSLFQVVVFFSLYLFSQNEILTSAGLEQDREKLGAMASVLCWTSTSVSFDACNGKKKNPTKLS